ncbi:TIGR02678 family protein [Thermotalea metallivorans]|uniref:TIGR02678 family protein n=1 Tax=Thermotalea metallivorans TaxID=520762 RepID=A0A140L4H2_9FIRM|nr:TIGR02678 family protein [Thermotalea metallivorans]KXG75447.1 hypothetical protein AN619_17110 [Thermotalea metallivorans]
MKELEILLERFWIIKEQDKELYYQIKDASPKLKNFLEDKLGYKLIINPYIIKLEKLPGKPENWMGIEDFEDRMEYGFLCLLLMFLEDKGPEEQFVLSQITEFVQGTYPGQEKVDWTLYKHRRHLIKVLRFAAEIGLMKVNDGDEQYFANAVDTEVLYENTGLSKYFMRNFTGNLLYYRHWQDIENEEWVDIDKDRGRIRRNRVYRRLVMSPAVYSEGIEDADYLYIKNYRNMLQKDIEEMLESQLHVHKNGAFVILDEGKNFCDTFPNNKNISDIVLQMNGLIVEEVKKGSFLKREDDTIHISMARFEAMIEECLKRYMEGWSKEYREMKLEKLYNEVIKYMQDFQMIQVNEGTKEVIIMPLAGKVIGCYSKDFTERTEADE